MSFALVTALFAQEPSAEVDDDEQDQVVVTSSPPAGDSPSEASLDRDAIDAARVLSAQDLLRSLAGIQLSQHGSEGKAAQFFLRGFDAAHGTDLTVGVDGFGLNEPSHIHGHGYADSGLVIPEAMRSVRLRKGPFGLDQGNLSTAGDVDFKLGVPQRLRGTAMGSEIGWPLRTRLWSYYASPTGSVDDVVAAEVVGARGAYENRQTKRAGVIAQKRLGAWLVRGAVQAASFGLPGAQPLADLEARRIERGQTYTRDTGGQTSQAWLGAVYEGQSGDWGHRTSLDMRGRQFDAHENFTGYLVDSERGDERREFQRALVTALGHKSVWSVNDDWDALLYAGASGDRFRQFDDVVDDDGQPYSRARGGHGWQANTYLAPGVEGFVGERLELEAGVRVEALFFDYREDQAVGDEERRDVLAMAAPRARATVYPGDKWYLVASAGRGFRGPEANSVVGETEAMADEQREPRRSAGQPVITTIDAVEVGAAFEPMAGTKISASGFGFFSAGEFVYDHVSRMQVDLGATRRLGAELAGRTRIGDHMRLRAHVTAVDARFVDGGESIPFAPPLEAGISGLGRWTNGLFGGATWRGMGSRPLPFGARAAPVSLVDAHVGWEYRRWELRLNVDNVLDSRWNEGVYHYRSRFDRSTPESTLPSIHVVPGDPRMMRLNLKYRW